LSAIQSENADDRSLSEMRQKTAHVAGADRNAARSRLISGPDEMEKDRRAAIARPGGYVPVEHQTDVVEPVLTPHLFMARLERRLHQPVVVWIIRLITPQHIGADAPDRQFRGKMPVSFAAPETVKKSHRSNRRCAVTFPLDHGPAAAADRGRQGKRAATDDSPALFARSGTHNERRRPAVSLSPCFFHFSRMFLNCLGLRLKPYETPGSNSSRSPILAKCGIWRRSI